MLLLCLQKKVKSHHDIWRDKKDKTRTYCSGKVCRIEKKEHWELHWCMNAKIQPLHSRANQSRHTSSTFISFLQWCYKILKFLLLPLKWIINLAPNLYWRKCKIFRGSNFLLIARFLFVLSCISPKKRHPKEPVVPEKKDFNLSKIYCGPYLPKVFIDSRLSGRLTPAVSGRKRPF